MGPSGRTSTDERPEKDECEVKQLQERGIEIANVDDERKRNFTRFVFQMTFNAQNSKILEL